jgi:hypothetical protein
MNNGQRDNSPSFIQWRLTGKHNLISFFFLLPISFAAWLLALVDLCGLWLASMQTSVFLFNKLILLISFGFVYLDLFSSFLTAKLVHFDVNSITMVKFMFFLFSRM